MYGEREGIERASLWAGSTRARHRCKATAPPIHGRYRAARMGRQRQCHRRGCELWGALQLFWIEVVGPPYLRKKACLKATGTRQWRRHTTSSSPRSAAGRRGAPARRRRAPCGSSSESLLLLHSGRRVFSASRTSFSSPPSSPRSGIISVIGRMLVVEPVERIPKMLPRRCTCLGYAFAAALLGSSPAFRVHVSGIGR